MLLLDRQTGATTQSPTEANRPSVSTGRVQLRLRADGQVLELPPGKTTIGSSPRCNVRIEKPGVQPLHCLIVEGQEGLRVRSWVANTTLNGVPFEESALAVGDCLCLGKVEVEVIDPRAGQPQAAAETPVVESKDAEQIRVGRDRARIRSRRLLDALRQQRTSHHELCQQVLKLQESHLDAIAEQNEISGKLENSLAELAAVRRQLGDYQAVERARQQLATQNEQLGFEIGELSAQINELNQSQTETVSDRQKLAADRAALEEQQRQLGEANNRLQNELGQVADEKNAISEQHRQLIDANARLQIEFGQLTNEKRAADEQCWKLADEKSHLQSEFGRLADEKNSLSEQHRQLTDANAGLQGEVHQLANEKATADEQCRLLAEQKSQLQSEFDGLADEKNTLSEERRQLGEANSRLQSDVVQLANEKASADEHNRQLVHQMSQLTHEVGHLTEQRAEIEAEREGLRRQNEQLLGEARELAGERSSMAEERTSLCQERSELRQQNEALRARIAQLNDENSAMAVGKLTLNDQRDTLDREVTDLRVQVAKLSEENTSLATAKASLAEEQARLIAEKNRLAEIEREMGAAVAGREDTSAELYRALLQLAEMQERDEQSKAVIEAFESLSKEHDHLHEEKDQLKEQLERLSEERAAVEGAWQALSAEAATLNESQQRLADDNATLVASLDEARQQIEQAQLEQAELASAAAELQRERAAKLQAEANVAAAIADGEQRLAEQEHRFAKQAQQYADQSSQFNERLQQQAEQSRQLAESIQTLERQLAAAAEMRDSLARAREEAQLQLSDVESRRAEQSRRIKELESQLAAAELRAAAAVEAAANQLATEQAERASHSANEQPTEFRWSSARGESALHDEVNADGIDDVTSRKSLDESPAGEVAWDRPASAADAWRAAGAEGPTNDSIVERTSEAWSDASALDAVADEPNPWAKKASSQVAIDASTFGEDDSASLVQQPVDEAPSIEQSSTHEQVTKQPEVLFASPVFAKPEEPKSEISPKAKPEPVSFIERYSHLLEEDSTAGEAKPERPNPLAQALPLAPAVARSEEAVLAPKKSEEEDSIEQYMAKLLQRVRGDSDGGKAAREQPTRMPLNAPAAQPAPTVTTAPENRLESDTNASDAQPAERGEMVKRRVSSPAPATDLGALRALANETARLAISRHELRKLRRNAVTKVIVSTLAGVTSLWLMLDSEDWRTMQFITACVALMVAVYWAGETFRTLINSMRIKPYEGPDAEAGSAMALPIDVESDVQR